MKTHILLLPCPTHFMIWRAWLELLNKATLRKSLEKWPKIVENGQNQTEIKLILPGKTELEVHQLTPSKLAPLNPPVSAGPER